MTEFTKSSCNVVSFIVDPCGSAPCKNNAVCANQGTTDYKCTCVGGFTGKDCDVPPSMQIFHFMCC